MAGIAGGGPDAAKVYQGPTADNPAGEHRELSATRAYTAGSEDCELAQKVITLLGCPMPDPLGYKVFRAVLTALYEQRIAKGELPRR